ncbi:MAG TPA: DUF29 domain-containing protein [Stellaceae bacterium]|nr:DUF29 domain-containing protein [Stellaceae bacterium]
MPRNAAAYDEDFFAWTEEQARLLRAGDVAEIDALNLAEEIESVGKSDRREIRSRLIVLLTHLLKWRFQPNEKSSGWLGTIGEQRDQIEAILEDSPSLRPVIGAVLSRAYKRAHAVASQETGLSESTFPADCPFTPEQILAVDFLPDD